LFVRSRKTNPLKNEKNKNKFQVNSYLREG